MAKHGLPIFPIGNELKVGPEHTPEQIEWLLEHGELRNTIACAYPDSIRGEEYDENLDEYADERDYAEIHISVRKRGEAYIMVLCTSGTWGADHTDIYRHEEKQYNTLDELKIPFTVGLDPWKWFEYKPGSPKSPEEEVEPVKHGLPIYPIWNDMFIQFYHTPEEIEWLLEHGKIQTAVNEVSEEGVEITKYIDVCTWEGAYIVIYRMKENRADHKGKQYHIAKRYDTLEELLSTEHLSFTKGQEGLWWRWIDFKPQLDGVVYSN